ncbi:hypothetical protein [Phaeocystidibacter luteus]|uniref:DUF4350 domain-containing protein n=1 Tax=Phaeocystidibacter luteus TaxID=911197 RepID=A0A6N6RLC9_9FLAO|nr:hypothetical protein [Phaeocystidibacter luteus]KAB2814377.1 hypothetical protein F8C67_01195 [Phaeocystidibacter luteus]
MKNNAVIYVVLALAVAVIAYFLLRSEDHWYYGLDKEGETPYDLGMYHELIEARNGTDIEMQIGPIEDWNWDMDSNKLGTIAFVNRQPFFDSIHEFVLDSMVTAGHVVVMYESTYSVRIHKLITTGSSFDKRDTAVVDSFTVESNLFQPVQALNFLPLSVLENTGEIHAVNAKTKSASTFNHAQSNDTIDELPQALVRYSVHKNILDTLYPEYEVITHVSDFEDEIIGWKVPRGNGYYIILLAAPHLTNYCLSNPDNFQYASDFTMELPSGFYWFDAYRPKYDKDRNPNSSDQRSPITFLLSYRSLRWAWFVLVGSLVAFLIFRTQRRQRVIPIINRPKNQTLEFAKSLGILQSKSANNHASLALEIKLQFAQWCKTRMRRNGKIDNQLRDTLKVMLPEHSGEIESLFYLFNKAELHPEDFNAHELNKVYSVTRYIYNHV